jgi:catechol 2,3-dioxygenase-like lactoylglutathione lyase family enzyme
MFANTPAFSGFAVDDIEAARTFYGETLGLNVTDGPMGVLSLELAGDRPTMIYPKPDFKPATYTILNFQVEDVGAAVDELTARGVEMERYGGFDQDEKGVMRDNGPTIAWFTDPAVLEAG